MRTIVADASVILKWFLPAATEDDAPKALQLRDLVTDGRLRILIPSLIVFEAGNVLSIKEPILAEKMIQQIINFSLHERPWSTEWLNKTLWLTSKYKVTFYDACYHALALVEGCDYVTSDKQYVTKTASAGSAVYLPDWQE